MLIARLKYFVNEMFNENVDKIKARQVETCSLQIQKAEMENFMCWNGKP